MYYTELELEQYVGKILKYEVFGGGLVTGRLTKENGKYWLPFCGGVNATSVKIYIK